MSLKMPLKGEVDINKNFVYIYYFIYKNLVGSTEF